MRKIISGILAVCMLFCGALITTAGATTAVEQSMEASYIDIMPLASEHIRSWSPLLSRTMYGASVSFTNPFSGSIRVELQNSSGNVIASFTESFTNRSSIAFTRNRATPAGTYRIVIRVTIGNTTTVRTSAWIGIS